MFTSVFLLVFTSSLVLRQDSGNKPKSHQYSYYTFSSPTEEDCEDSLFHVDPDNCPEGYFRCKCHHVIMTWSEFSDSLRCVPDGAGGWTIEELLCPPGTAFHPELQICDWPGALFYLCNLIFFIVFFFTANFKRHYFKPTLRRHYNNYNIKMTQGLG